MMMKALPTLLLAVFTAGPALGQPNLVMNPCFEEDSGKASPANWETSGDRALVDQTLALDRGRDGSHCARLTCTRFRQGSPSAHAMVCQMGVSVRKDAYYKVAFWARAENLDADVIDIGLSDTSPWRSCGLAEVFLPTARWERCELVFLATHNCSATGRFQISFKSTGTLWLDDVEFREAKPEEIAHRPGQIIAAAKNTNLVPNASFECGTDGWGSANADPTGNLAPMNQLFGVSDSHEAYDQRASLKIELSPQHQPVAYLDWYEVSRTPILAPLAANIGFIEVEPGKRYTLSVYMKANQSDTPARLAVRQFRAGDFDKLVRVTTNWQRYTVSFTPTARWCYVLAGPDLRATPENQNPPQSATVWLDAVQLEKAPEPTTFAPRSAIEFGIATDKPGNVFGWTEPIRWTVRSSGADSIGQDQGKFELQLDDCFDREVWRYDSTAKAILSAENSGRVMTLEPAVARRGFLRLRAKLTVAGQTHQRSLRLAVIPINQEPDSRFGVNHAYPWPALLDLSRQAGVNWVRDWSLKWQEVEPEKGRFVFTNTDVQIDRARRHGLQVLGLLPFPSSNWSSSAPASVSNQGYGARVAYAPRDTAEFEQYVEKTIGHYKDRIQWWQCFNEPLFTDCSLPRRHGYDGATYARLVRAFALAARRADPKCHVIGGIGAIYEGQIFQDFERFFQAGALGDIDAVDIHEYPGIRPPEYLEDRLRKLNALMEKYGPRKPIWMTEYGYYADDEPTDVPITHASHNPPLASELRQAQYTVRWATICLANGVDKVFYHSGSCEGINDDQSAGPLCKYAAQPRKVYAAQAVMAHLLTPRMQFSKKLDLGSAGRAYLFSDGRRLVAVIWAPDRAKPRPIRLADPKFQLWDLMGRPQAVQTFTPTESPVYIIAEGVAAEAFEKALALVP